MCEMQTGGVPEHVAVSRIRLSICGLGIYYANKKSDVIYSIK